MALSLQSPLLRSHEQPAFEIHNGAGKSPVVLVCDHADNAIPETLDQLGLEAEKLQTHIAIDLGAAALSRALANILDSRLVLAKFSRLVIDLNRPLADPTLIPEISDGVPIPGNVSLRSEDRQQRIEEVFNPYHEAIAQELLKIEAAQNRAAVVAIHSFTPSMAGFDRPWHIGILWTEDQRMSKSLIKSLSQDKTLCVGDNQPYDARKHVGYTVEQHGGARDLPHVLIEVRQDLLTEADQIERWASLISRHLTPILRELDLMPH